MWAWPKGKPRGKLSPEHLAATRRKPKPQAPVSPEVAEWVPSVRKAHRSWRRRFPLGRGPWNLSGETFLLIASLPSVVGTPVDPAAQKVFNAIVALLFRRVLPDWNQKQSIPNQVRALPQTREGLLKIAEFVEATGKLEDLRSATFHFETVVQSALLIPSGNIKGVVEFVLNDPAHRERTIKGIFHPRVIKHYEGIARGLLGPLADPSYREQIRAKVRTVRATYEGSEQPSYHEQLMAKLRTVS
jgi:hypothetical protein